MGGEPGHNLSHLGWLQVLHGTNCDLCQQDPGFVNKLRFVFPQDFDGDGNHSDGDSIFSIFLDEVIGLRRVFSLSCV